jgi:hypothetical protein
MHDNLSLQFLAPKCSNMIQNSPSLVVPNPKFSFFVPLLIVYVITPYLKLPITTHMNLLSFSKIVDITLYSMLI